MRFNTAAALAATLTFASAIVAEALEATSVSDQIVAQPSAVPEADILAEHFPGDLRKRQGGVAAGGAGAAPVTTPATQAATVTTMWVESELTLGPSQSTTTYVEIIYTQTFASIIDQGPAPGSGQIGYGTLQKHGKRDAMPITELAARETGIAGRVRV